MAQKNKATAQKIDLKLRQEHEKKAQIIIEKRKKAYEKAQKIVEELIEDCVSETDFTEQAKFIERSHYDDIVEERLIGQLCGYPLCANKLKQVLNQKFYVSTKQNRVYDVSERKKFCSNHCFKASRFLKDQISTEPIEKRDPDKVVTRLKFLEKSSGDCGQPGDVVVRHPSAALKSQLDDLGIDASLKPSDKNVDERSKNTHSLESVSDDSKTRESLQSDQSDQSGQQSTSGASEVKSENAFVVPGRTDEEKYKNLMALIDKRDALITRMSNRQPLEDDANIDTGKKPEDELCELVDPAVNVSSRSAQNLLSEKDSENGLKVESAQNRDTQSDNVSGPDKVLEEGLTKESKESTMSDSDELKSKQDLVSDEKNAKSETELETKSACDVNVNKTGEQNLRGASGYSEVLDNIRRAKDNREDVLKDDQIPARSRNTPFFNVQRTLYEWKTAVSVYFITNMSDDRGRGKPNDLPADNDTDLEKMFVASMNLGGAAASMPGEKVPDYEQLVKDAEASTLKVREFYCSENLDSDDDDDDDEEVKSKDEENDETLDYQREPVVPLLDSTSQMPIRRKLVLNSIDRCLSKILPSLNMLSRDVSTHIQELVSTFHLTKDNVTMRPAEWNLLTFILLKLLAARDENVAMNFQSDRAKRFCDGIFRSFHVSETDVSAVLQRMKSYG
ncbi:RNA polymerase II subunit B1 CTD phosphatase Rpap2-like [Tubulanus polymorphus]|uniref:RNA polymerase II subunit B1 CTD phosphatase Rpap2-like n=1 Tax=Tubulanus polymorphus TaxID=672921 RepID=UPI003DA3D40F